MAEGISFFSPSIDEGRWFGQGTRALKSDHTIEVDFTPTIFQVPKWLKETKPEAYTPSLLGLGPYHHLRPELHSTHTRKLALIKKYQDRVRESSPDYLFFSEPFIIKMASLEALVRASYDKYLDIEGLTVVYSISVDSFYLLDFLGAYGPRTESTVLEQPGRRELVEDVLKLENQIPNFALLEVWNQISLSKPQGDTDEAMLHSQLFYYFCKAHSPLRLAALRKDRRQKSGHLLAHMYYLIVNNRGFEEVEIPSQAKRSKIGETGIEILKALSELGLGGALIKPLLFAFTAVEVLENSMLTKEIISNNKEPKEQEAKRPKIHEIPAASELSKKHKMGFMLLEKQGIKDIKLESLESIPMLHLPEITLEQDSEVVLRNLIAYEAAIAATTTPESTIELAEYIDLMGDLLQTPQDVALLREKGIVKGSLNDEQVVGIFAEIRKPQTLGKLKEECASQKVGRLLKELEKKNETKWTKLHRSLKKRVKEGVEVVRKPCVMALKYVLYILLVVLVVLQLMQAYCQVNGCNKGGSKSN
ncbi:hypothetical protein DM860_002486 [Cuscuta australis]|uniref:Uncharacterized protein n=1 Tax=Cuscuta australis TaxID=267555 RepID=A0A328D1J4_9ASTE|nr:hypothetical protein DM860_002486 [Cuscuta australis]